MDKEFKMQCDGDDEAEEETNDVVVPPPLPLEAPASSRPRQDAESMLRAAVQVLRATAPASADFSKHPEFRLGWLKKRKSVSPQWPAAAAATTGAMTPRIDRIRLIKDNGFD